MTGHRSEALAGYIVCCSESPLADELLATWQRLHGQEYDAAVYIDCKLHALECAHRVLYMLTTSTFLSAPATIMSPPLGDDSGTVAARGESPSPATRTLIVRGNRIDSRELFAADREVTIAHGEDSYRLRLTSQNKLILTK